MRALPGIPARVSQLTSLWEATTSTRELALVRAELAEGEGLARVPNMPDRSRQPLTPVNFGFLPAALRSAGHLWRSEPDRESEDSDRWREILWSYRTDGWLSRYMREVDAVSRLHGSALYLVTPERDEPEDDAPTGLSLRVFDPTRFVALSHRLDDRVCTAALILWHSASRKVSTAPEKAIETVPSYTELTSKVRTIALGAVPDSSGQDVWIYVDEDEWRIYEGSIGGLKELPSETIKHGYGRCPAGVVSSDAIQSGLSGRPWGGSDLVANLIALSKLLTETGETAILKRGQPTSTGTMKGGKPTLGPTHLIEMELGGTFNMLSMGGDPASMVEVAKVFAALIAIGCDVPISATWRLADLTDADIAAAELVLSADRATRAPIMALAEHQIAKTCAAVWKRESGGEQLSPWRTKFKAATPPLTAQDRLDHAAALDDRKLAPRVEVAALLRPELQREDIEEQLEAADEEKKTETQDRVTIAGHAEDLEDGRPSTARPGTSSASARPGTATGTELPGDDEPSAGD